MKSCGGGGGGVGGLLKEIFSCGRVNDGGFVGWFRD